MCVCVCVAHLGDRLIGLVVRRPPCVGFKSCCVSHHGVRSSGRDETGQSVIVWDWSACVSIL